MHKDKFSVYDAKILIWWDLKLKYWNHTYIAYIHDTSQNVRFALKNISYLLEPII